MELQKVVTVKGFFRGTQEIKLLCHIFGSDLDDDEKVETEDLTEILKTVKSGVNKPTAIMNKCNLAS